MTVRPLRRILSMQACLMTIVPFAIVTIMITILLLPQIRADVEFRQQELAKAIGAQIESYLASALADVKAISFLPMATTSHGQDMQQVLDAQIVESKSLNLIYVADRQGRVSTVGIGFQHNDVMHRTLQGMSLANSKLFQDAIERKEPVWSDTFRSIVDNGLAVAVAVPTKQRVVFGEIDLGRLTEFLRRTANSEGQLIFVLDSRGQVIADQQGNMTGQKLNFSNLPLIKRGFGAKGPLSGQIELNGHTMTGSIIKIPAFNWNILIAQPKAVLFKSYRTISAIVTTGLLSALLLGVTAALVIARRLARKFEGLATHARNITAREESLDLPRGDITEINQLADDLQLMADSIRKRERQLLESEQRLQLYFQRLPISSIVWGKDYRVQQWNPAAERIFGYTAPEALGRTVDELIAPANTRGETAAAWRKLLEGSLEAHHVNVNRTRDGRIITCAWTNTPFHDNQGAVLGTISVVEDITDRVKMEAQLHKLSHAVEQSPVTIVITDMYGNIEYVNPKFTELTGYLRDEAVGKNPRILKSGRNSAAEYRRLWEAITAGTTWQGEFCNKKKSGDYYWEAAKISPILNSEGVITHFVAVKEDITEKRLTSERLLLDAIRFQNLSELSILSEEPDQRIFDFSIEAAVQITLSSIGYIFMLNEDETILTLNSWSKHVMPACAIAVKPTVYAVKETGLWGETVRRRVPVITNDYEKPNPLKRGTPEGHVPIRRHMNIPLIDNGKIVLIAGVANKEADYNESDVQQLTLLMSAMWRIIRKKRAEALLRESEDQFRQMFAQNDDAIILINMKTLRIIDANPAALALYDIGHEQLPGCRLKSFIERDDYRKIVQLIAHEPLYDGVVLEKAIGFRADGTEFPLSFKGKILQIKNEEVILCSIRDITDKIRLEEAIRVSQAKLIQTNKMTSLGMLVSGVGHEINNPNHCIAINTSVLSNIWEDAAAIIRESCKKSGTVSIGGLACDEAQVLVPQLFAGIAESSQRISAIVANMRDFVKKGQGDRPGNFDVNRAVMASTAILWHNIQKYTDSFRQDLAESTPPAYGNAQQVEQVIINLLMNALQALPDKTRSVTVTTAFAEATGDVTITIEDEGKGMDKKTLLRLAEPFFTTREAEGGTGLGIYISTTIVKDYNGSLRFASEPGKGTTATIRLPVAIVPDDRRS